MLSLVEGTTDFSRSIYGLSQDLEHSRRISFALQTQNKMRREKDSHSETCELGQNFKNKVRGFIQEFSSDPFTSRSEFRITRKKQQPISLSVFNWLNSLISLDHPTDAMRKFLQASEEAKPDSNIKVLHRITNGQFCEDRVELALNILQDNDYIDDYQRHPQYSAEDHNGYDFTVNVNDEVYHLDVKAGRGAAKDANDVINNVQHKSMSELVRDLYQLTEGAR